MGELDGKIAVITGSGRGQGLAGAKLFASEGASVVVNDLDEETVAAAVAEIRAAGGVAEPAVGDISNSEDVQRILSVAQGLGGLDILYNNAGIGSSAPRRLGVGMRDILNCREEDWNRVIAINLGGPFLMCKYGIPMMIERGGGVVINTSSIGAIQGMRGAHAYAASKGGLSSLTRAIAVTYGPQGIRCNAILPGAVDTEMIGESLSNPAVREAMSGALPLRRIGTALDMANAALWLASERASFVTGQEIVVDGGTVVTMAGS